MSYMMAAGAAIGAASSIMGAQAAAKQADRLRDQEMKGAIASYRSTEANANIMKAVSREAMINNIGEISRAGGAEVRDVAEQTTIMVSKLQSQSEGLTSGVSKGRQMIALRNKANEVRADVQSKTSSMLGQAIDAKDKMTNELNQKVLNAYDEMAAVLSTPGATYQQNPLEVVNAGIQGAQAGASLASSYKSLNATKVPTTTPDLTLYKGGADWGTSVNGRVQF